MARNKKVLAGLMAFVVTMTTLPALGTINVRAADENAYPPLTLTDTRDRVDNYDNSNPELLSYQYTKPADGVTAPGDVFAPFMNGTASTLVISGVTAQAGPDDSVVLQGKNFSDSSKVWVYGQTSAADGGYRTAVKSLADDTTITAVLPPDQPYGMYLVWVEGVGGFSRPVRVNAPQVEWISTAKAKADDTVSLYGTNLSHDNGTAVSYVYLRPWGADASVASVPVEVTEVNPYKVTFRVPAGLTGQSYEVWLHNGHGGDYGWDGPQMLQIADGNLLDWETGRVLNVTDYGALPESSNDDTAAILAAVNASNDGDTIYFPAGQYMISECLFLSGNKLHFTGDSNASSILYTSPDFTDQSSPVFLFWGVTAKFTNLGFLDDKDESKTSPIFVKFLGVEPGERPEAGLIENCDFRKESRSNLNNLTECLSLHNTENITIRSNTFTAPCPLYINKCVRVFVEDNTCYGNWRITPMDGSQFVKFASGSMQTATGNNIYALDVLTDPDGTLSMNDYSFTRAIVLHLHGGTGKNMYIADNDMQRIGNPNDNCGEIIMFEAPAKIHEAMVTGVSGQTLTLSSAITNGYMMVGSVVTVIRGTGESQSRRVTAFSGNQVTLAGAWDIVPDTTSRVLITNPFINSVVYDNDITGYSTFYEKVNAGAGIQAYGNMLNFRVAGNRFSNMHTGVLITAQYNTTSLDDAFSVFTDVIISDNNIWNVRNGVTVLLDFNMYSAAGSVFTGPIPARMAYNIIVRGNRVSNARYCEAPELAGIGGNGIVVGSEPRGYATWGENSLWRGEWIKNTVVEHNTISNVANAHISIQRHQGDTLIRDNVLGGVGGGIVTLSNADEPILLQANGENPNVNPGPLPTEPGEAITFLPTDFTVTAPCIARDVIEVSTSGGYALTSVATYSGRYDKLKLQYMVNAPAGSIAQTVWGSGDSVLNLYVGDELLGAFPIYGTAVEGHLWYADPIYMEYDIPAEAKTLLAGDKQIRAEMNGIDLMLMSLSLYGTDSPL